MDVISIKDFPGIRIGNAQNIEGGTAVSYTHLTLPTT